MRVLSRIRLGKMLLTASLIVSTVTVTKLSAQNAGDMWGVNRSNQIFRWSGSGWENIPGALKYRKESFSDLNWPEGVQKRIGDHD